MIMRGSLVVLALAITPLVASTARAQDTTQAPSPTTSAAKCVVRDRGNPSDSGVANRADPTLQGNKDCAPVVVGHSTISGSVYFDIDLDGLLGPDEVGLSGWTVQLTGASTQTTMSMGDAGTYSFTGLLAGTYIVCVNPNLGWRQTGPKAGTSCPSGLGYMITAPNTDMSFPNTNFGYVNQP
jgi:hypothetical protein